MRVSEPVEDDTSSSQSSVESEDSEASSSGSDFDKQQVSRGIDTVQSVQWTATTGSGRPTSIASQGAEVPFEELVRLQQEGVPLPQLANHNQSKAQTQRDRHTVAKSFKRENKNRPVEQSSKRAVPRHRQVVETKLP